MITTIAEPNVRLNTTLDLTVFFWFDIEGVAMSLKTFIVF